MCPDEHVLQHRAQEVLQKIWTPGMLASAKTRVEVLLQEIFSVESEDEHRRQTFSAHNPIAKAVSECEAGGSGEERQRLLAMLEACSGSGKSLCAADYFVSHERTVYFLLRYEHSQALYECVSAVTRFLNRALDFDVSEVLSSQLFQELGENPDLALDIVNATIRGGKKWHFLWAVGCLLGHQSEHPLSVEDAAKWRAVVLLDEAIPTEKAHTSLVSDTVRLVLIKRLIAASYNHLVILGTNTLVLNFQTAAQASKDSRNAPGVAMKLLTNRALPPFLPRLNTLKGLVRIFGSDIKTKDVHPFLANTLANACKPDMKGSQAEILQACSAAAINSIRKVKTPSDWSLYAAFQIAVRTELSQAHLSKGFACLNPWVNSALPQRGAESSILNLEQDDSKILVQGQDISRLRTFYISATMDPVTVSVCAGGGNPFLDSKPALQVLQELHSLASHHDETAVDALKRDGNKLEAFWVVAVALASWGESGTFLRHLARHVGLETEHSDVDILSAVQGTDNALEVLKGAFANLVPLRNRDRLTFSQDSMHQALGWIVRMSDAEKRDAKSQGACNGSFTTHECKNLKDPLSQALLGQFISHSASRHKTQDDASNSENTRSEVVVLVVSALAENTDIKQALEADYKGASECEWVVLHLAPATRTPATRHGQWRCFPAKTTTHRTREKDQRLEVVSRMLIVVEIGLSTLPFDQTQQVAHENLGSTLSSPEPRSGGIWNLFQRQESPAAGGMEGVVPEESSPNSARRVARTMMQGFSMLRRSIRIQGRAQTEYLNLDGEQSGTSNCFSM